MAKKINKRALRYVEIYALIILGCAIAAFGGAVFLTPCNIVSGGVTSIGIILNNYLEPLLGFDTNSLVSAVFQVVLLVLGWLILGKSFGFRTAIASLLFIGFYALFNELDVGSALGLSAAYDLSTTASVTEAAGTLTLMGIAGGALQGIGVGIAYVAGASTGGTDIPARILAKFTNIKEGTAIFVIDAALVIIGVIVFHNFLLGIIAVLTAFVSSLAVQVIYNSFSSYLVVDIISDKYKEIQEYVHTQMENDGHASTIIHAQGGYSKVEKEMLRVVIYKKEETKFRMAIYEIDPSAFIVISQAKSTHGYGFDPLLAKPAIKSKKKKEEKK